MTKIERLKKGARDSAIFRGHVLGNFRAIVPGVRYRAICKRCGKFVDVVPCPQPNDIDVGGPAVALGCED